jgi:site-specific DNA-methyltransferase (adenine-specific)
LTISRNGVFSQLSAYHTPGRGGILLSWGPIMASVPKFSELPGQQQIGRGLIVHDDCFTWMRSAAANSIHGIVTDPPYGVKEYEQDQLEKRTSGSGGIWRIPPTFGGSKRQPLPRFTALNTKEREDLYQFFRDFASASNHVLRPGAHVFLACNAFLCQLVYDAIVEGGLEFRGQIIRLVRTLRGGDRPKNAELEFPDVCSLPRGSYEPWGIFRKPMPSGMKVSDCLRKYQTGGLRRRQDGLPFNDLIQSGRTSKEEKEFAAHPSLKPQSFMRELVHAILPLGSGVILDPFMGSGSTIAAANAMGLQSIGIEKKREFFELAADSIQNLSFITIPSDQASIAFK